MSKANPNTVRKHKNVETCSSSQPTANLNFIDYENTMKRNALQMFSLAAIGLSMMANTNLATADSDGLKSLTDPFGGTRRRWRPDHP